MASAYALLTSDRRPAGARIVLVQMRSDLAPIARTGGSYGLFDAAIILLREGSRRCWWWRRWWPSSSGLTTATRALDLGRQRGGRGGQRGGSDRREHRVGAPAAGSNRELLEGIIRSCSRR